MARKPYYAVANGRTIGVFTSWEDCKASVDKFPGCQYKGFNSHAEATSYIAGITLMKKQQKDMETPKQRSALNDSLKSPKPWHKYEADEEHRYQALGSRSLGKSTARLQSFTLQDNYDVEIVDVVDVRPFGGNRSSLSQEYVIDDRPTQVVVNTAKRPSPVYPELNRKKARTAEREVIDLTESPPKPRSYNSLDIDVFLHSPESLGSPTSSEELSFLLQDQGYPLHDVNRQNSDKAAKYRGGGQFKPARIASPTSSEELSFALQNNHSRGLSPHKGPAKSNGSNGKSHTTSTQVDKPISSVPFTNADCSPQQKRILDFVAEGKNVFFTGSAGVGKSFVLNKVCEKLKSQGLKQFTDFFMTASTGIAAVQIGGMTVHSFAGVGKGEDGVIQLKEQCARNKRVKKQWKNCKVLIIDEISMLSDEFFDKLDQVGRHVRESDSPFGGIQLVLCGDFFQLPPVAGTDRRRCPDCGSFNSKTVGDRLQCLGKRDPHDSFSGPCNRIFAKRVSYIFQSNAWKAANFNIIELTKIYRQSDTSFVAALNKARIGKVDIETLNILHSCCRPLGNDASIKPTKIYPIRALVQDENIREFEALGTPTHFFSAVDNQTSPPDYPQDMSHLLNDLQATKELKLRVGAQVMLLANLDVTQGLVNGSRGVIVDFVSIAEAIQYLQIQAGLRGSTQDEGSLAEAELRAFAGTDDKMQFPKVLFETRKETKEVSYLTEAAEKDNHNAIYMDYSIGLEKGGIEDSNSFDDGLGSDDS